MLPSKKVRREFQKRDDLFFPVKIPDTINLEPCVLLQLEITYRRAIRNVHSKIYGTGLNSL